MNLTAYPSYRKSPVEWLGEIPTSWSESRLKYFASAIAGGTPDTDNTAYWSDGGDALPWVAIGDMSQTDEVWETTKSVSEAGRRSKGLRVGNPGTILFAMYASVGEVSVLRTPAVWNQALLGLRADDQMCLERFLFYSLKTVKDRLPFMYRSNTQNNLNADQVANLAFALPTVPEQHAIVRFLDRQTAKIDALIAKQEQLIATLREDRTATITHAVTKGLDPNVEMQESGVEWLGMMPSHWAVEKGTWIGRPFGSEPVAENDVHDMGEIPFLKVSSLNADGLDPLPPTSFVSRGFRAEKDFLAFPKRGAAIFGNKVNIVRYCAVIDPNLMGWKLHNGNLPEYFGQVLKLLRLEEIADVSTVPQINNKHIAGLRLPRPPLEEQHAIVGKLAIDCQKIDALIGKATQVIATLQEYRSALITDAVTGKIDARGAA